MALGRKIGVWGFCPPARIPPGIRPNAQQPASTLVGRRITRDGRLRGAQEQGLRQDHPAQPRPPSALSEQRYGRRERGQLQPRYDRRRAVQQHQRYSALGRASGGIDGLTLVREEQLLQHWKVGALIEYTAQASTISSPPLPFPLPLIPLGTMQHFSLSPVSHSPPNLALSPPPFLSNRRSDIQEQLREQAEEASKSPAGGGKFSNFFKK